MEYRSSASLLGLPLVHVATGALVEGRYRRGAALAWSAVRLADALLLLALVAITLIIALSVRARRKE